MSAPQLDDQELLHLALRASNENRHEDAISYLKRALEAAPNNAKARYMLGAEHAEIGLYDRAAEEMAQAVKLDPSLFTAQFQLGLLHITSGRIKEAQEAWKPLDKLGENNPFYLFKSGMLHLVRDEFDACVSTLEKGIQLNTLNAALNDDMRRIIDQVKSRPDPGASNNKEPPATAAGSAGYPRDMRLTAYQRSPDEKD